MSLTPSKKGRIFDIYYYYSVLSFDFAQDGVCVLCGRTKNGVSWRFFLNLLDFLHNGSYNT